LLLPKYVVLIDFEGFYNSEGKGEEKNWRTWALIPVPVVC